MLETCTLLLANAGDLHKAQAGTLRQHKHRFMRLQQPSKGLVTVLRGHWALHEQVGFPVMIKATAGGGGRGMRLAKHKGEFLNLLRQAQQEADAAFGNNKVYLERYVQNPRHIEFQVRVQAAWCSTVLQQCCSALAFGLAYACSPGQVSLAHKLCGLLDGISATCMAYWQCTVRAARCLQTSTATASTWASVTAPSSAATRSCWKRHLLQL